MTKIFHYLILPYGEVNLSWMVGMGVTEVSMLERDYWKFSFEGKAEVGAECPWCQG